MGLETVTNLADLNPLWPTGAEPKKQGDDHLRNIKKALLDNIVGMTGAVIVTGVDGGAVNAYTLTPAAGTLLAYGPRMLVEFSPTVTNTGAATMNISALGVLPIKAIDGTDVAAGDLVAGRVYFAICTGSTIQLAAITKNYVDALLAALRAYVDMLAFTSALPSAPGGTSRYQLETLAGAFFWTDLAPEKASNAYALNLALRQFAYSA